MQVFKITNWTDGPLKDRSGKTHFESPVSEAETLVVDSTPGFPYGPGHICVYLMILPDGTVKKSLGEWPPDRVKTLPGHFYS